MEANKTLVTYISLGVVVIIVLGLLLGSLVRAWHCPAERDLHADARSCCILVDAMDTK